MIRYVLIFLFVFSISTSCSKGNYVVHLNDRQIKSVLLDEDEIIHLSYKAAEVLSKKLNPLKMKNESIIITTYSNNDNIKTTNSLGRLVPYLIGSRLVELGFKMVDLRLRDKDILIKEGVGELILSRDIEKLKKDIQGSYALCGHYTVWNNKIYIHSEIISLIDQSLIASYDFVVSGPYIYPSVYTKQEI